MKRVSLFVLLCFMLCLFSQMPAPVHATTWWDTDWNYKMKLTIDQTKVDADLTDFPVLVHLTAARIDWSHVQDDLDDLRFLDSTESTVLKAELENYTLNSEAWIWVKIPAVDDTVDTDFYMYYGNAGAASAWDPENVWEASAVMVQHMTDNPDNAHVTDSTGYDNDGTKKGADEPIETNGEIDSAQSFDGVDDRVLLPDVSSLQMKDKDFTFSAWINIPSQAGYKSLLGGENGCAGLWIVYNGEIKMRLTKQNVDDAPNSSLIPNDVWINIAAVFDSQTTTNNVKYYINGILDNTVTFNYDFTAGASTNSIGAWAVGSYPLQGFIDEVRIYNQTKSAEWIKADYNSGADTLLIYGAEACSLIVYYNIGVSKLYINGTQRTNGTAIIIDTNTNVNATATVKNNYIFFKHQLTGLAPNFTTPYMFNMTNSYTLWTYAVVGEVAGASSGALIFTALLAGIILIPFLWWRRRR